ncbi:hypothetical protein SARI_01620 [Salmonella enterica subsp. arizonae serovar 62:z4,z23:-]|uniref:Uncharacterized protein n=1 Tax=Salmonella arizonae (strain ATCC BAA-731 / CDC346-86 / RSK2980) TaxID=41514 RepID=A9MEQ5_SALAR|nr:hypothetical protein SARI_01620 [Salmonella enterica subsp. arizonae serovar 62:z4,z23:-]
MRIYPGIFKPVKKTVNRSSKFIFHFFRLFTYLRKLTHSAPFPQ